MQKKKKKDTASDWGCYRADDKKEDDVYVHIVSQDIANMVWSLHHFLMTQKDVPDSMLESCDTVHEFVEKSLLKMTVQKK
jgi:hypothetical protein